MTPPIIEETRRAILALFLPQGRPTAALQADQALMLRCLNDGTAAWWARQMHEDAQRGDAEATYQSAKGWYAAVRRALQRATGPAEDPQKEQHDV